MAQAIAATISKTTGPITVTRDGKNITLNEGDSVYNTDTIITGKQTVELSFADGASAILSAETTMTVQEFSVDMAAPSFVLNLAQGAMRTISGEVVEQNPDAFKIVTPKATVGIRGTTVNTQVKGDGSEVHAVENLSQGHNVTVAAADGTLITISSVNQGALIAAEAGAEATPYNFTPAEMKQLVGVIVSGLETLAGDEGEGDDSNEENNNDEGNNEGEGEGEGESEEEASEPEAVISVELDQSLIAALTEDSLSDLVTGLEDAGIDVLGLGEDLSIDTGFGGTSGSDSVILPDAPESEGLVLTTVHVTSSYEGDENLTSGTATNNRIIIDTDTTNQSFSGDVNIYTGEDGALIAGRDEINAKNMTGGRLVGDANTVSGGNFTAGSDTINVISKNGGNSIYGDVHTVVQGDTGTTISFGDDTIVVSGTLSNTYVAGDAYELDVDFGGVEIAKHGNDYIEVGQLGADGRVYGDFVNAPNTQTGGNDTIVIGNMSGAESSVNGGFGVDQIRVTTLSDGTISDETRMDTITVGTMSGGSILGGGSVTITNGFTGGTIGETSSGGACNITISGKVGGASNATIEFEDFPEVPGNIANDVVNLNGVTGTDNHLTIKNFNDDGDRIIFGSNIITAEPDGGSGGVEYTNGDHSITIYFQ